MLFIRLLLHFNRIRDIIYKPLSNVIKKEGGAHSTRVTLMDFALKIRERSRIVNTVASWQETLAYPVLFALLCAVSGLFDKRVYLPIFAVIGVLVVFSALFTKDLKVLLVPFFTVYYSLGSDSDSLAGLREKLTGVFDPRAFFCVCLIGAIMFIAICFRLGRDGVFADIFKHRGPFLYGILAIDAALILNGLFCWKWQPADLMCGVLFALGLTFCYCTFGAILRRDKSPAAYVAFCTVCTICAVLIQVVVLVLRLHAADRLFYHSSENLIPALCRGNIQLAWGYATYISGVLILGIPAAIYLAKDQRFPAIGYMLSFLFFGGALLTGTRSGFLTGSIVLIICALLACFQGKNKRNIRFCVIITLLALAAATLYIDRAVMPLSEALSEFRLFFRLDNQHLETETRLKLWKNGIEDFLSSPVFGVGFSDGGVLEKNQYSNVFNDMYHNVVIQFMGATGIVGLLAFIWHLADISRVFFYRFSVDRALLLMLPITILVTSLADNFFFCFNFQIYYAAYLVLVETDFVGSAVSSPLKTKKS